MPKPLSPPADPLLTLKETCAYVRRCRGTIREARTAGTFPAPIQSGRNVFWRQSWLDAWIDAQPRGFGAI